MLEHTAEVILDGPNHSKNAIPDQDLSPFLEERYEAIKHQYPGEGRRKWRLRVVGEFWKLTASEKAAYSSKLSPRSTSSAAYETDADPLDVVPGRNAPALGLVIRTDYSNEAAWDEFLAHLRESEAEMYHSTDEDQDMDVSAEPEPESTNKPPDDPMDTSHSDDALGDKGHGEYDNDSDDESENDGDYPAIFTVINPPPTSPLHAILNNPSSPPTNLTLLRLFTDVSIRRAPLCPPGTKRVSPPNRLIERDLWQEVYQGQGIWVYDALSNTDQCVRVVSLEGEKDTYGMATGNSWRARVSHICELQVNLASGDLQINFGGWDRYDHDEQLRNLSQAESESL